MAYISSNPMHYRWLNAQKEAEEAYDGGATLSPGTGERLRKTGAYARGMIGYGLSLPIRVGFVAFRAIQTAISLLDFIGRAIFVSYAEACRDLKDNLLVLAASITEVVSGAIGVVCPLVAWEYETWLYSHDVMQRKVSSVTYHVYGAPQVLSAHEQPSFNPKARTTPSTASYKPQGEAARAAQPELVSSGAYEDVEIALAVRRAIEEFDEEIMFGGLKNHMSVLKSPNGGKRAALECSALLHILKNDCLSKSNSRPALTLSCQLKEFSRKNHEWIIRANPSDCLSIWQYPADQEEAALALLKVRNAAFEKLGGSWTRVFQEGIDAWMSDHQEAPTPSDGFGLD